MLKDDTRKIWKKSNMSTKTGAMWTFRCVWKQILRPAYEFLTFFQKCCTGLSVPTDFSKGARTDKIDVQFTDTGLTGRLEGKDTNCVDMVFSLLAALVDWCSELTDASMAKGFVKFVEVNQNLFRYGKEADWSDLEVDGLGAQVQDF